MGISVSLKNNSFEVSENDRHAFPAEMSVCEQPVYQAVSVENSKFDWSLAFPLLGLFAGFRRPDRTDVSVIREQVGAIHKTAEAYKAQVSASTEPEARAYFTLMFWQTEIDATILKVNHAINISRGVKFGVVGEDGSATPATIGEKGNGYIKEAASRLFESFKSFAFFFTEQTQMSTISPGMADFSRNHLMLFGALVESDVFLWNMTSLLEKFKATNLNMGMFFNILLNTGWVEDVKYVLRFLDAQTWRYSQQDIESSKLKVARTVLLPLMKEVVLELIKLELVKQNLTPRELQKSLNAERRTLERFIKKGASPAGVELLTIAGVEVFYKGISLTQFHPVEISPDAAMAVLTPPLFRRNFPDVEKGKVATELLANAVKCPEVFLRELKMLREKLELVERTMRRPERK